MKKPILKRVAGKVVPKTIEQIGFVKKLEAALKALPLETDPVFLQNGLIATHAGFFAFMHAPQGAETDYILVHGEDMQALETDANGQLKYLDRVHFLTGFHSNELLGFKNSHFRGVVSRVAERALLNLTAIRHEDDMDTQYGPHAAYRRVPHRNRRGHIVPGKYDVYKRADHLLEPELVVWLDHSTRNIFNHARLVATNRTLEQTEELFEHEHALDCQAILQGRSVMERYKHAKPILMQRVAQGAFNKGKKMAVGMAGIVVSNVTSQRAPTKMAIAVVGSLLGAVKLTAGSIMGMLFASTGIQDAPIDAFLDREMISFTKKRVEEYAHRIKRSPFSDMFFVGDAEKCGALKMMTADQVRGMAPNLMTRRDRYATDLLPQNTPPDPSACDCTMDEQVAYMRRNGAVALHRLTGMRLIVQPEVSGAPGNMVMFYNQDGNLDITPDPPEGTQRVFNANRIIKARFSGSMGFDSVYCTPEDARMLVEDAMGMEYAEKKFIPTGMVPLPRDRAGKHLRKARVREMLNKFRPKRNPAS